MSATARVSAYPWGALETLNRSVLGRAREVRRALERTLEPERIAAALSEILSTEVRVVVRRLSDNVSVRARFGPELHFATADGAARIDLTLDTALAALVLSRVLQRNVPLMTPGAALDATLSGALSAIALEAARRASAVTPLRVVSSASPKSDAVLELTVLVDGKPYEATAHLALALSPTREEPAAESWQALGNVPIALPLVVGHALVGADDWAALECGDALFPGPDLWIAPSGTGHGALAAPEAERGVTVEIRAGGSIVLVGKLVTLVADAGVAGAGVRASAPANSAPENSAASSSGGGMAQQGTDNDERTPTDPKERGLKDAVLDAPVVVRIELGSVSMPARSWAALRPGDVIETRHRITEPVVLRIAGREVARGELVNVEGALGVRVRELVPVEDA